MVPRLLRPRLRKLLRFFPAVALLGPRQCGKTTLAKSLGGRYYDLEHPAERDRLDSQWPEVEASRELVILDEAQEHPGMFSILRGTIDADRKRNGRFLLLGSVAPWLMRKVSESLAGRLGTCDLAPLLLPEVRTRPLDQLWLCGGYPGGGVLRPVLFPDWQKAFLRTLTERDLPHWGLPAAPLTTLRLLKMLAAVNGSPWNASEFGRSLGLNYHTVNAYLDFLEGAYQVRRIHPWFGNVRKRLVRSPRVYWRDSGVLHALLETHSVETLYSRPWAGASWEGFVIEQILAFVETKNLRWQPYFFRTSDGKEIDLVLEKGGVLWAVEIKLSALPGEGDVGSLASAMGLIGAKRGFLLSRTREPYEGAPVSSTNLAGFLKILEKD